MDHHEASTRERRRVLALIALAVVCCKAPEDLSDSTNVTGSPRDRNACTGALYRCTNIPQSPYEFSRIFAGFTG